MSLTNYQALVNQYIAEHPSAGAEWGQIALQDFARWADDRRSHEPGVVLETENERRVGLKVCDPAFPVGDRRRYTEKPTESPCDEFERDPADFFCTRCGYSESQHAQKPACGEGASRDASSGKAGVFAEILSHHPDCSFHSTVAPATPVCDCGAGNPTPCECLVRDKEPSAYHNVKCPRYVADKL